MYDKDIWVFEVKDTLVGVQQKMVNESELKVYPNPARDYVVFELPSVNNNAVIPTTNGRRNPPDAKTAVNQGDSSPAKAGFGMTTDERTTVVITNLFGQKVAILPVKAKKTVWDTRKMKKGIYFYRLENNEKLYTGKIVIQ